jgi:formylmethanofuran dehydrogenase subunit E
MLFVYKELKCRYIMEMQILALPVQCSKCDEVFDLGYDLAQEGNLAHLEDVIRAMKTRRVMIPMLCWNCRNM